MQCSCAKAYPDPYTPLMGSIYISMYTADGLMVSKWHVYIVLILKVDGRQQEQHSKVRRRSDDVVQGERKNDIHEAHSEIEIAETLRLE